MVMGRAINDVMAMSSKYFCDFALAHRKLLLTISARKTPTKRALIRAERLRTWATRLAVGNHDLRLRWGESQQRGPNRGRLHKIRHLAFPIQSAVETPPQWDEGVT